MMIYIDSDGVLADFDKWVLEKRPELIGCYRSKIFDRSIYKILAQNYHEAYATFDTVKENEYLFDIIRFRENVRVLTALPDDKYLTGYSVREIDTLKYHWTRNKLEWFKSKGIPAHKVIVVDKSSDKVKYCRPGDILLDDYIRNCDSWNSAGGIAIKMHNRWYDESQ